MGLFFYFFKRRPFNGFFGHLLFDLTNFRRNVYVNLYIYFRRIRLWVFIFLIHSILRVVNRLENDVRLFCCVCIRFFFLWMDRMDKKFNVTTLRFRNFIVDCSFTWIFFEFNSNLPENYNKVIIRYRQNNSSAWLQI